MQLEIEKRADKALKKIEGKTQAKIRTLLTEIRNSTTFYDTKFEKLKGSKTDYKIRIGSYRIVLEKITNTHVRVTAIADRKDIYKLLLGITI